MPIAEDNLINQRLNNMEEKLAHTLLAEILEDIQNIKIDQESTNSILSHHSKLILEFNDYLASYKIEIPDEKFRPFVNGLKVQKESFKELLLNHQKVENEAKENRLKFIGNRIVVIALGSLLIISLFDYGFKSLQDRAKFKYIYDYIYYTQPKSRPYLQSLKVDLQNDSIKKAMRIEIKEIKKSEGKSNE